MAATLTIGRWPNASMDKIDFDDDGTGANAHANAITGMRITFGRRQTDNSAPYEELARRPDTGFAGFSITFNIRLFDTIGGSIADDGTDNRTLVRNPTLAKLLDWDREANAVRETFPEGRFGFTMTYTDAFNTSPTATAGFKLGTPIEFTKGFGAEAPFWDTSLTLEFSGDPSEIGDYTTPT